jgi:hypothetical protein
MWSVYERDPLLDNCVGSRQPGREAIQCGILIRWYELNIPC